METEQIIRESWKLRSRLFDHKPVISSELHQFVNEFETKKAKRGSKNLDATLALVHELNQTHLPNASLLLGNNIPKILASLEVGTRMMDKITEKRGADAFAEERHLRRKRREAAWNVFMEELCQESNQIEEEYGDAKNQIRDYFGELNDQIRSPESQ